MTEPNLPAPGQGHEIDELRRSVDMLSGLLEIAGALTSELDLDRLLAIIVDHATQMLAADRSTLFIVDRERDELWSRIAQGQGVTEIRIPGASGIAGYVATSGAIVNLDDAYDDPRFNRSVDRQTGYRSRSMLCVPLRDLTGLVVGVLQVLNKRGGAFTSVDEQLLTALGTYAAIALVNASLLETHRRDAERSAVLLDVMRSLSTELELDLLLARIMAKTTEVMNAERSSLFLVDQETRELWFKVAEGSSLQEVRIPLGVGIAGYVAATGETLNIVDAYADARFNQEVDRQTGFHTRNMLCLPMRNSAGTIVGVLQVLNKRAGAFQAADEELLAAVASQAVITIENASLFADIVRMKNYNESVLRSMATGVVTLDQNGAVSTTNPAANRMLDFPNGLPVGEAFASAVQSAVNPELWLLIQATLESGETRHAQNVGYRGSTGAVANLNVSTVPLLDHQAKQIGVVAVMEDVTREQRLVGTLSRVVSRQVAEQIIASGEMPDVGGESKQVTVVMTDIRNFTGMTEVAPPEEIVEMLNNYFDRMIRVVFDLEGTLDKFVGDTVMAVFGSPISHEDDPIRAVRAGVRMRQELRQFNQERVARGQIPIETGVGICDGVAIAGMIGSRQKMEYTVIGDTVNTAARLEGLTKEFPNHKLVFNESVYEHVKDLFPCDFLAEEHVKGRTQPVRVYGIAEAVIHTEALTSKLLAPTG